MIKVIMHGCNGKMGNVITNLLSEDNQAKIVAGVDAFGEQEHPFPVFKQIEDCNVPADVIIDFSTQGAIDALLKYCMEKKLPCVLCTTGLSEEQLEKVEEASKEAAILKSANMSLGINMLFKLLKDAVKVLEPAGFDMEIVEKHHNQKVDAPSGTALALAEAMNEECGNSYEYIFDRSKVREKRDHKEIGISAVRGGSIVGEHDVIFAGIDEVITFSHTAYSKAIFGKGAISAAKFLAHKPAGIYDMSHVIEEATEK